MPGPPPKPIAASSLTGSWRGAARKNRGAPEAPAIEPDTPAEIESDAELREIWDGVTERIASMGILSRADDESITRYCHYVLRYRRATRHCLKHGDFVMGKSDLEVLSPQAKEANDLGASLLRLEIQFGLTPSARAGFAPLDGPRKKKTEDESIEDEILKLIG